VRHRLSLLLHDRPNLLSSARVIGCFECCLSEIVEVEGATADRPNLLSSACVIGCFERVCAVWVLAMGKVLLRSVTCLIKVRISLIGGGHQFDLAVGLSNFISDKISQTDGI
jgi:hypothetical protein